jgi:ABC-type Fe3+/spermidine/putrescine transport system ATPase subunit
VRRYFKIYIGARSTARDPSHRRNIGMVLRDYALIPAYDSGTERRLRLSHARTRAPAFVAQVSEVHALVGLEGFQKTGRPGPRMLLTRRHSSRSM